MKTTVIGSFIVDLMARTPHLPVEGETVKGSLFRMGAGGKGYNQAVAAAKAGADVIYSTKVGNDSFADLLYSTLSENNLKDALIFKSEDTSTGVALISVDENTSQNEIVVVLGASATITDSDIEEIFDKIKGAEYLLLQLEINTDALEKIITRAHSENIKIILNPAPIQPISDYIYPLLYAITPNEVEAATLAGIGYEKKEDAVMIAEKIKAKGVSNVIITLGKNGVYLSDEGGENHYFDNYKSIKPLDTTGAGDAFSGGLLAALGEGKSLYDSVAFANVVSNLSVTKLGTSSSMPSREEIDAFLQSVK